MIFLKSCEKTQLFYTVFKNVFFQVFRRITYECTGGSLGGVEGMLGVDSAGKLIYTDV